LPRGLYAQAGTNTVNLDEEVSMGMLAERVDHVIGVDTHRDSHSVAVCNTSGAVTAEATVAADAFGYKRLLRFAREQASGRRVWAIEGTGSFGAGLTSCLLEQGEWVVEIDRPARPARRNGAKSDALDAARAAREALARKHLAQPRRRGEREALRVLLATREGAILSRTKAIAQLQALIVNAPEQLRHHFRPLTTDEQLARCARLRTSPAQSVEHRATIIALRSAARRALSLEAEASDLESQLERLVAELAPILLGEPGVGVISAAQLLNAWSHRGPVPLRRRLRLARRRSTHPSLLRPAPRPPAQPRRRPPTQPRPAHDHPLAARSPPRDEALRDQANRRRKDATRGQALPQAPPRPALLPAPRDRSKPRA
jgi:hypothetical protein